MKKLVPIAVAVLLLSGSFGSGQAGAAKPRSGGLNYKVRTLKWSGGPYDVSYPVTSAGCLRGASDPMCDHYKLKINMGQGAKIQIVIKSTKSGLEAIQSANENAIAPNDLDMFLYDASGREVAIGGTNKGTEKIVFTHRNKMRNKPYEIRVVPFLVVPGTTYKGTITTLKYVK